MLSTHEIRKKYLDFFKQKSHAIIASASLLPENDPTTLFTGSGMQPMVPFLLGEKHPRGTRIADSQKCFRAQDMDEVGDNRHTTFFEMLGNWSLGDYFKQEQIPWMFEFITEELTLDPKNLYITCFAGHDEFGIPRDEESAKMWQGLFAQKGIEASIIDDAQANGMQGAKIFYYPASKNWWSRAGVPEKMPAGEPGGPDTEMFWDFSADLKLHENSEFKDQPCHVNCDCGRFMEIGNNVFMEYFKTESGFEKLSQQNVDFGGGLERMSAAVRNDADVFTIDLFDSARGVIEKLSGKKYGEHSEETYAFRVTLDHLRAATFLIADGASPSNKDQGYFTRRFIRRAVRFASKLGINENFCAEITRGYIETYAHQYPDLETKKDHIFSELHTEEDKFRVTLEQGIKEFEKILAGFARAFEKTGQKFTEISAKQAFKLYDTYGFPLEMTEDLAKEHGLTVDKAGFEEAFKKHQEISRQGSEQKFKGGLADTSEMSVKYHTATHLLHASVLKVLGSHATQKGSNITPERLRFDFAHPEKMTDVQKKEVEDLVNGAIARDYSVTFELLPYEEAKKRNAIGLFEDNYGDQVKVYTVGDPLGVPVADPSADTFSRELCGGPHVEHTGVLGKFKIVKEESSSAGIRRIKAVLE
ncbi:MAG: alanine--tRNA ligase [Candidatus Magasanikbacteria bacterium]|nr:alanine--tRNA ligase [Candidatus Magasanikbacteria bacterium]